MSTDLRAAVYDMLTGEDDGRVCKDIPEAACREQPGNFLKHVLSLSATKTGDGLSDPKLVLSWLLSSLGAPAFAIGFLVPVREAGALLPQLAIAGWIRSLPRRKWAWAAGSAVQGLAVLGMSLAAFRIEGAAAGWTILALLAVFALARSVCSVSYKDVLGKTVSRTARGTATGTAGSVAAALILAFGAALSAGLLEKSIGVIALALVAAGALWLLAAVVFATLAEEPGATEGGGNPLAVALRQVSLLRDDPQLVRFIVVRGLLVATALAPPYILTAAGQGSGRELGDLGPFVLASGLASVSSSFVWGRLSDFSSRKVLMLAAVVGALALAAAGTLVLALPVGGRTVPLAGVLFVLMVAYQGVRLGRSTHIVDMADEERRAAYTALSNSIIGVLLLFSGAFGLAAGRGGPALVMGTFAGMCVAAALVARGLEEVQD